MADKTRIEKNAEQLHKAAKMLNDIDFRSIPKVMRDDVKTLKTSASVLTFDLQQYIDAQ